MARVTRSANIREVARAAGVSHQTVSNVINGNQNVKASTRQAVLDAIDALGFRPNRAAQALAGGPVRSVTVLTSNTRRYGFAAALEGVEEAGRAAGFAVGIRVLEPASTNVLRDAIERSIEPAGSLVIIAYDSLGMAALSAVPPGVPVAAIVGNPPVGDSAAKPAVWFDHYKATRDATNYLLHLGHKTVHYVANWSSTNQRNLGWSSALDDAGAAVPEPLQGGWEPRDGYRAGEVLARDLNVTAVLCGNDDLAIGVIRAMHQAGRAVPESVSVVGLDDIPLAAFCSPTLTTVRQDFVALGKICFGKLLSSLDHEASRDDQPWPEPELVVRESAGHPPHSRRPVPRAGRPAPEAPRQKRAPVDKRVITKRAETAHKVRQH